MERSGGGPPIGRAGTPSRRFGSTGRISARAQSWPSATTRPPFGFGSPQRNSSRKRATPTKCAFVMILARGPRSRARFLKSAGRRAGVLRVGDMIPPPTNRENAPMHDLTRGSVTRHLFALSAFMAVSMVFQTLYYLADLYFVGRLGKEAIAAVGLAGNLVVGGLAIPQTLHVGTTTLILPPVGQKKHTRAHL